MCSNVSLIRLGQDYINPANIAAIQSKNEDKGEYIKEGCDIILNGGQRINYENYSSEKIINILQENQSSKINFYA